MAEAADGGSAGTSEVPADVDRAGALSPRGGLSPGRRATATLLLSESVQPRVVMELLGHSQMHTTMDVYSHVMPALAREVADRIGAPAAAG